MLKYIVNRNSHFGRSTSNAPAIESRLGFAGPFPQTQHANPRIISTYRQLTRNPRRINTYRKHGVGVPLCANFLPADVKSCGNIVRAAALRVSSQPTSTSKRNTISLVRNESPMPKRKRPNIAAADLAGKTEKRIDALLTLLAENPMIVISGQKIAREIGVSRSSVWRWTQRLRALGVKVKGHPRTGYQIERVPDVLSPSLLRRQLRDSIFGKRIHHFFKAGSTNTIALELGRAGEPHGAVVLAEEQTAGRGRSGRTWHSEKTAG